MCWRPLAPPLRGTAVYLVRSFRTDARIRSLTTGTFNRVVKDRIAFRLSGAPSVLDGLAFFGRTQQERIRLSSKPFKHIVRARPCQRLHPTAFPRDFHIGKVPGLNAAFGEHASKFRRFQSLKVFVFKTQKLCHLETSRLIATRNDIAFRSGFTKTPKYSAHAEAEDRKLRKDPSWRSLL